MSMTPEVIFNKQVWEILQDIQEEILATETGKPIKYRIPNIVGVGIIPPDRRIKILYKLQEMKVFEIQENNERVRLGAGDIFYLVINLSKFKEIYQKFQNKSNHDVDSFSENKVVSVTANPIKILDIPEDIVEAIWWILKEIKKEYLATSSEEQVHILFKSSVRIMGQPRTVPDIEEQNQAIRILEKAGAIKIEQYTHHQSANKSARPTGTFLSVLEPKFSELYAEFKGIPRKQSGSQPKPSESVPTVNNQKVIPAQNEDIEWPTDFQWSDDGKSFLLGDSKKLTFGAGESKRKDIFNALADQKGGWAVVGNIAKAIGESETYVRTVINQLKKKIVNQELQRYILIEPRAMSNRQGAYRVFPFPQSIKHR